MLHKKNVSIESYNTVWTFLYLNRFSIDLFNFHSFTANISTTKWNAQPFADVLENIKTSQYSQENTRVGVSF